MRETRYLAIVAAAILAIVTYNFVWIVYPSCSWCRFDYQMLWFWSLVFFAPTLLFVWSLFPRRRSVTYTWVRRIVVAHFAVRSSIVVLSMMGLVWPVYAFLALLGAIVDGLVIGFSPPRAAPSPVLRYYARSVALGVGGTICAMVVWSLASAVLVSQQAKALAGSRRYCIQVASSRLGRYAEAASLHALTGLRMQTPFTNAGGSSDFQFAFHAVLVVENDGRPQYYNWSHKRRQFDPISERTLRALHLRAPSCTPKHDFVVRLPWL